MDELDFDHGFLLQVFWNTDSDGNRIPENGEYPESLYGPFKTESEPVEWFNKKFADDTDVYEMDVIHMNIVKL